AIDHDYVARGDHLVQVIETALVLHLRDDARRAVPDKSTDCLHVRGALDEADADVVDTGLGRESEHGFVGGRDKSAAKIDVRNVDPFATAKLSVSKRSNVNVASVHLLDQE